MVQSEALRESCAIIGKGLDGQSHASAAAVPRDNERLKLLATALDNLAMAFVVAG
jgi:hypothetical protein